MDENVFHVSKATDRERINEALRMMDEWEKEEKEAADWDDEVDESDQYVNLPEHTRKLLDCLGMLQGTLNTYEVEDDHKKIERALRFLKKLEGYADSLATTTVILSNAMPSFKRYFQNIKKTLES